MKKTRPTKENKDTTKIPAAKLVPITGRAGQFYIKFDSNKCPNKGNTNH
jgi:hypothetical protein